MGRPFLFVALTDARMVLPVRVYGMFGPCPFPPRRGIRLRGNWKSRGRACVVSL